MNESIFSYSMIRTSSYLGQSYFFEIALRASFNKQPKVLIFPILL